MGAMFNPAKEIKTHIGKAKVYLNKHQTVRCMGELLAAIKIHIFCQKKILGTDKIEIEYSLDELMNGLSAVPELKRYISSPLTYKKGAERRTYMVLIRILRRIRDDMERGTPTESPEELEAKRKRQAMLGKMEEFLMKGDQMMVAAIVNKLVSESGGDSYVLMDVAERFYKAKDWRGVVQHSLEAIRKNPKEMRAYKLAINAYRFLKEYDAAMALFKQAIGVFGHHPNIYINLTKLYYEWGKPKKAYEAAMMTLKLEPGNVEAARFVEILGPKLGLGDAPAASAEGEAPAAQAETAAEPPLTAES
ncbi:hypothetical protein dsx2_1778 [Desulfovibrio sp. X2]|uniref:tetratricopeptide repeat protein n=1 Tax=Desulfovibrio sp. X2 TaxID=941449 RepID=UPI000358C819|nr:hypothetical protein [Desulfovibrio sp. X2]EPR44417.1 hypothetical protein dsx2_1778 [Desulfovibrio sp. X2]